MLCCVVRCTPFYKIEILINFMKKKEEEEEEEEEVGRRDFGWDVLGCKANIYIHTV